jgi:hypothetical protein
LLPQVFSHRLPAKVVGALCAFFVRRFTDDDDNVYFNKLQIELQRRCKLCSLYKYRPAIWHREKINLQIIKAITYLLYLVQSPLQQYTPFPTYMDGRKNNETALNHGFFSF